MQIDTCAVQTYQERRCTECRDNEEIVPSNKFVSALRREFHMLTRWEERGYLLKIILPTKKTEHVTFVDLDV